MARGRNRKPDALKALEGNARGDRLGGEPQAAGAPIRPKRMSKEAGWLWQLVIQNWMGELDTAELITLCDTWELLRKATHKVKRDPFDPMLRVAFVQYKAEFDRLAARFGMTPSDRAKIRLPMKEEKDELEKFFGVVG